MIDKNKTYRTRDGREVRIYATDGGGNMPVHGSVMMNEGWHSCTWMSDGTVARDKHAFDLIEVKPRIRRPYWINIYQPVSGTETAYFCKSQADHYAQPGRLACVKVEIDCEEGEGL